LNFQVLLNKKYLNDYKNTNYLLLIINIALLSQQISISQLNTNNDKLFEPKNSVDYYKQNDDIISMKYSGITKLNIIEYRDLKILIICY
jgi:hypothetical protein